MDYVVQIIHYPMETQLNVTQTLHGDLVVPLVDGVAFQMITAHVKVALIIEQVKHIICFRKIYIIIIFELTAVTEEPTTAALVTEEPTTAAPVNEETTTAALLQNTGKINRKFTRKLRKSANVFNNAK